MSRAAKRLQRMSNTRGGSEHLLAEPPQHKAQYVPRATAYGSAAAPTAPSPPTEHQQHIINGHLNPPSLSWGSLVALMRG